MPPAGIYLPAIPAGPYQVTAAANGFRSEEIESDAWRSAVRSCATFSLKLGNRSEAVVVRAELPLLDRATSTVGHMVSARTIQEIPLNGRHFVDLGPLVPGSVAPSQSGFSTTPIRGTGALAFNTAGNREEAVAYVVNGVTTNNLTFGSIGFPPPVASIQEFKVDNSTFSAEFGHVSGAVVNLVTRSGTDRFRGEAYEFFRNDALDARNFFEFTSPDPHPFERNQFGGSLGGPLIRGRSVLLRRLRRPATAAGRGPEQPRAQRRAACAPRPTGRSGSCSPLIPRANFFDSDGTPRFVGSGDAAVDREHVDRRRPAQRRRARSRPGVLWTPAGRRGRAGGAGQPASRDSVRRARSSKSLLTVSETHIFGPGAAERSALRPDHAGRGTFPAAALNPADFGIGNGVDPSDRAAADVVAGALNFGGPGDPPAGAQRHPVSVQRHA